MQHDLNCKSESESNHRSTHNLIITFPQEGKQEHRAQYLLQRSSLCKLFFVHVISLSLSVVASLSDMKNDMTVRILC